MTAAKFPVAKIPEASFPTANLFTANFPRTALGLRAVFIADTNPREPCVSCSLEVGSTFLILSYSKAKGQKCLWCGAISHSDAVFF